MINMPPTPPKPQQNRPVVVIGGALQIKAEASARANMAKQKEDNQDKAKTWNSWNKKPESWKEGAWKSDKSWKAGQWNQWHDKNRSAINSKTKVIGSTITARRPKNPSSTNIYGIQSRSSTILMDEASGNESTANTISTQYTSNNNPTAAEGREIHKESP